ncbi:Cbp6p NDAI_0A08040 [Naumovozyma dairenensis CBS 421]|uniref:Uncharacterized protein n=1 Tax=Naumovozyma dairenensis (strain ATCC 10597 / BCRC 20456 / CBS 421 / NBRC 0211 / NRRL Y-12639) TaxID=1071378 RepID=G0W570_NAUDC|nr:hypothetical protein NDAI_0A08040 [Naumovozyma dairenensis CBS 421]CCD22958.1 hypothetical protein NDAI_0A08040 [Naumovozyma dairenensis CBS 421]
MSKSQAVKDGAKQIIKILQEFPEDRIKHLASFKDIQTKRFQQIAGANVNNSNDNSIKNSKNPSVEDIKNLISSNPTSLALQKDLIKKMKNALQKDHFDEQSIQEQINSMNNLVSNKYKNYYKLGDKLYKPAGNPTYYQRIMDELQGKKKETLLSAARTVIFGK